MPDIDARYTGPEYAQHNPTWGREFTKWKAGLVRDICADNDVDPSTVADIGCGNGDVIAQLADVWPTCMLTGFDISPHLDQSWSEHVNRFGKDRIAFVRSKFDHLDCRSYDLVLALDVFEHVANPFEFLSSIKESGSQFVFHIPLDLSAVNVFRKNPLINARRSVGHLHFYTKDLALELLAECGYRITEWRYTRAFANVPNPRLSTMVAAYIRRCSEVIGKDRAVRLLGGETLLVLAK